MAYANTTLLFVCMIMVTIVICYLSVYMSAQTGIQSETIPIPMTPFPEESWLILRTSMHIVDYMLVGVHLARLQ